MRRLNLPIATLTIGLLLLVLAGCGRTAQPYMGEKVCDPPVGKVRYGQAQSPEVEKRLKELFEADQAARKVESINWDTLRPEDAARRAEVLKYLADGAVVSGQSQYYAAMVFQHGNCADHYRLANQLAEKAMEQNFEMARWLYAATMDRYLLSVGKPQKYGTQYKVVDGKKELFPMDPSTTNEERAKYNVPVPGQTKPVQIPAPKPRQ